MANPTTNFGWVMPTSTDLVTDLPADFAIFGQAVDTSMAELKGGTTGQVLSKTSNTDMDFTWVTTDDANAIQNAIVDAKGDLIAASAADTPARLAVGNNGESIYADSTTSTGLRYQGSISAGRNITLNGNYDIWQRGSSFTATTNDAYNADRWQSALNYSGGTTNVTRDTSVPNGESIYSLKVAHATANTSAISEYSQRQRIEAENVFPLIGKTVTLSFWYRSNKTGNHGYRLYPVTITGAADTQGTFSVSAANTWEKKTITTSALFGSATAYTGSANAQALWIMLGFQTNGSGQTSIASGDYFQIAQVQLESGSVATNFLRNQPTIATELAACQRYYEKSFALATTPANGNSYNYGLVGSAYATGTAFTQWNSFQVIKRTTSSTITFYRNSDIATNGQWAYFSAGWATPTTTTSNITNDRGFQVALNKTAGFTLNAGLIVAGEWTAEAEL